MDLHFLSEPLGVVSIWIPVYRSKPDMRTWHFHTLLVGLRCSRLEYVTNPRRFQFFPTEPFFLIVTGYAMNARGFQARMVSVFGNCFAVGKLEMR